MPISMTKTFSVFVCVECGVESFEEVIEIEIEIVCVILSSMCECRFSKAIVLFSLVFIRQYFICCKKNIVKNYSEPLALREGSLYG